MAGGCPGDGTTVTLAMVDTVILLQGLAENDDIPLECEGATGTGSNVTAFGNTGHDMTLTIMDGGTISLALLQPDTLGACSSTMTPQ